MGELMDCAHRWEAKYILGMTGRPSAPAWLGTSIHAGTAIFDTARAIGKEGSIHEATDTFVETLNSGEDVDWRGSDISKPEAESIGVVLTAKYCQEISPQFNYVGVEMETKPFDIEVDGIIIRLTGTMDRARASVGNSGVGISDIKSGKRAVDQETGKASVKGHAPQLGIYELLYEHTTGAKVTEPATIVGLQTTKQVKVGVGTITNAREQLIGADGEHGLLEYAALMIKAGMFPPNPKSALCSEKFCVRYQSCKFKE
jgi:hypothetical protein